MKISRRELRKIIAETLLLEADKKVGNYQVRRGDTLVKITQEHSPEGVTVEDNAKLNGMKDPAKLQAGKEIKIYVTDEYEGGANGGGN